MTTKEKIEKLENELQELKNEVANQNQKKLKKGDFVIVGPHENICIFDGDSGFLVFLRLDWTLNFQPLSDSNSIKRLATKSEKQQLIEKLRENGKDWDAEKLEIVDYRWRAERLEYYWTIKGGVVHCELDFKDDFDNKCYESGNYFKTEQLAKQAFEKVKKILLTLKHS